MLYVDIDITEESLHRQLNEFFHFPCHVSINSVSKTFEFINDEVQSITVDMLQG